jgi:PBP1b-binding outer membrane lipoprotein LpoB
MQAVSKAVKGFSLLLMVILFAGCVQQNHKPTKTSVELQAIQAKDFDTTKEIAFAATMSTFQDLGYKVESADLATGFISAEGPTNEKFVIFVGQVMETLKATAFVESMGTNKAKIRLNFVNEMKSSSGYGMEGGNDAPVEEPAFYQDAFAKITKGVYLRENLQ